MSRLQRTPPSTRSEQTWLQEMDRSSQARQLAHPGNPVLQGAHSMSNVSKQGNGTRLKMPSTQLAKVTRARNALDELRRAGSVGGVIRQAVERYQMELAALKADCNKVHPVDERQMADKESWMEKNLAGNEEWLAKLLEAVADKGQEEALSDLGSSGSKSKLSTTSSRRQQLEAEEKALLIEKERYEKRLQQEEEERQLLQRHEEMRKAQEEELRQLREQREKEELEAKLAQIKARKDGLSRASSVVSVEQHMEESHQLPELPVVTQPTMAWLNTSSAMTTTEAVRGGIATTSAQLRPQASTFQPVANQQPLPRTATHSVPSMSDHLLLQQTALLPKSKLPIFKGDHLEFLWFIRAFELQVEAVTECGARRLHLLLQHLEGDARTLVVGYQLHPDAAIGYSLAKSALVTKYGNPIRQALAFKSNLLTWPLVKSSLDFERFSVQLKLCESLRNMGSMNELDASSTLLQLMYKLPTKQQEAWQRRVHRVESRLLRECNFSDFVQFVTETSEALNHPVFGQKVITGNGDGKHSAAGKLTNTSLAKTMATTATSSASFEKSGTNGTAANASHAKEIRVDAFKPPCLLCEGHHATSKCKEELTKDVKMKRLQGLCFSCLKTGHFARKCRQRLKCELCQGSHPTVMHENKEVEDCKREKGKVGSDQNATTCATREAVSSSVAVAIVPVKVWLESESASLTVNAVLDPASTATFITSDLVKALGLDSHQGKQVLQLTTMSNTCEVDTRVVQGLKVADLDCNNVILLPPAYTTASIPFEALEEADIQQWQHLQNVPFTWMNGGNPVALLIGMNAPRALTPLEVVQSETQEDAPYAIRTRLGWCVNGPLSPANSYHKAVVNAIKTDEKKEVITGLKRLYYCDFTDAFDFVSKGLSQEDRVWLEKVNASIQRVSDGNSFRYQVNLPFKDGMVESLKNNYGQALQRLKSLQRKFLANPQFQVDYANFMKKMEDGGYVEEVDVLAGTDHAVSYVVHHGVYHPQKPGKIRVVFNCASKFQGVALNDCLMSGPDLTNTLVGVLMRFRQEPVAFVADIESMFYRVLVPEHQRDVLRYLWWPGGVVSNDVKCYRLKVHLFGATSSPSVANFALRQAGLEAWKAGVIGVNEDVKRSIENNFYVDDCLKSVDDENKAIDIAKGLISACRYGGFRLAKFMSTSVNVLQSLSREDLASNLKDSDLTDKNNPLGNLKEKALGVVWSVSADAFMFRTPDGDNNGPITKRGMLSKLSAVYDPLGMAAPVIIVARILFRDLTKQASVSWDDTLEANGPEEQSWQQWIEGLQDLVKVRIPRCYRVMQGGVNEWQLHVFCDASLDAYAAVGYLRQTMERDEEAHVAFVFGKARVSPPKVVTVPRLELTAAKLATEVARIIESELQYAVSKRVFWSDSQTVLKYINNSTARFHTFVANRVQSILSETDANEWRFVPTRVNPADEGSRGIRATQLEQGMWLNGPEFLRRSEDQWPCENNELDELDKNDPEVKCATTLVNVEEQVPWIEQMAARYSSMHRFRKAIAILLRFRGFMQSKEVTRGMMTVRELQEAEAAALRWLQWTSWPEDLSALLNNGFLKRTSEMFKLSPTVVDGMVVMRSRTRFLLPIVPRGNLACLLVKEEHERQGHLGRQSTKASVLMRYWIVGLDKIVRRVIKGCGSCQRRHSMPQPTEMSVLPNFRIQPTHAFETTGVDFFGPFYIVRGRAQVKVYGVLFTCAVMRAVHLEVAESLSGLSFIYALRRFIARRGEVKTMISDNGTNFVGAESQLRQELISELHKLQDNQMALIEMRKRGIEWQFNAPGASHHGGFWERLIRSVRQVFEAIIEYPLTYEAMITLMCEIEAILNNRPIAAVSDDPTDFEALSPNHLLLGRSGPKPPPGVFSSASRASTLKNRWKYIQRLADQFWKRWSTEYCCLLHKRSKWHKKARRSLTVGDVVLVLDPQQPREYWPLGRVLSVKESEDGLIRVVEVRTAKGVLVRPITKLCLLESASIE